MIATLSARTDCADFASADIGAVSPIDRAPGAPQLRPDSHRPPAAPSGLHPVSARAGDQRTARKTRVAKPFVADGLIGFESHVRRRRLLARTAICLICGSGRRFLRRLLFALTLRVVPPHRAFGVFLEGREILKQQRLFVRAAKLTGVLGRGEFQEHPACPNDCPCGPAEPFRRRRRIERLNVFRVKAAKEANAEPVEFVQLLVGVREDGPLFVRQLARQKVAAVVKLGG